MTVVRNLELYASVSTSAFVKTIDFNFCKDRQEFQVRYFAHINRNKTGLCESSYFMERVGGQFDSPPPLFIFQEELI